MTTRKRYSEKTIRNYWANTHIWHQKFDSQKEFLEQGTCFACGMDYGYIERAHIKALVIGGEDHLSNIHILCKRCHQASELIYGEMYYIWFRSRNFTHIISEITAQYNILNMDGSINQGLVQEYIIHEGNIKQL